MLYRKKQSSTMYIIGLIAGVLGFAALAVWLGQAGPGAIGFDQAVQDYLLSHRSDNWTSVAKVLSQLGTTYVFAIVLVAVGIVLIAKRRVPEALLLLLQLAVAWGAYKGLKGLFERPRPEIEHLVEATGYSFPSGNALMASAFYLFAALLMFRLPHRGRAAGTLLVVVSLIVVLVVGASRLYLGVHYLTDILAGYAAGLTLFCLAALVLNRAKR
ncbi:phosphatase PAP2 family protein [Paenibacillus sp. HJGM_3]|uniref:phosphatase PAP2 family protein n=1 Tax=Paenibacillus sp. HJGM_3 TaxID=3379816 RepID=UPI00385C0C5E